MPTLFLSLCDAMAFKREQPTSLKRHPDSNHKVRDSAAAENPRGKREKGRENENEIKIFLQRQETSYDPHWDDDNDDDERKERQKRPSDESSISWASVVFKDKPETCEYER